MVGTERCFVELSCELQMVLVALFFYLINCVLVDECWENHAVVLYDYNNLSFEVVDVQCTCLCVGQVFSTGKLISFTKNNLEVCVKQVVDHHHVGLRDDVQGATLQNLACHFDKYAYSFSVHHN